MRFSRPTLLLFLAGSAPAVAGTLEAVNACVPLANDRERLACYDAALGRPAGAAAIPAAAAPAPSGPATPSPAHAAGAPAAAPAAAAATAAAAPTGTAEPVELFGLSQQARRDREGVVATESITARVASVGAQADGRQVLRLDNEQTWVQVDGTTRVRLRAGDEVTIRRAALGSFLLSKAGSGSMRVRRER